jgi:transposase
MPAPKRSRVEPTDDWGKLQLRFQWPEQSGYELIRPVVLFGYTAAERAQQTGISASTISRKVNRFDTHGVHGLFEAEEAGDSKRLLPPHIRRAIAELVAEYPAFRVHELATICYVRFNRRPSARTIRRVLAEEPAAVVAGRRFPVFGEIADPVERRAAIVRLHTEGWNIASIAEYLQTSRPTVYATLQRWIEEGVRGLADKS